MMRATCLLAGLALALLGLAACDDGGSGPEPECRTDADCEARAGDWTCDPESGLCTCSPDCKDVCCGDDGCGSACPDICTGQSVCNPDNCLCETPCLPASCQELGKDCGLWPDGCAGDVTCGPCADGWFCDNAGLCQDTCTPNCMGTCCGDDGCGFVCSDACGATGQTCDSESCLCQGDCQPMSCADMGARCGMWFDGCGTDLDCGDCPSGQACNDYGRCE